MARATWFFLALVTLIASVTSAAEEASDKPAAKQPTAKKNTSSLDEELLRDLGDDPLQEPDKKPPAEKPAAKPEVSPLDEDLLRNLEGGEDRAAGDSDSQDPLQRLNQRMRQAEQLLRARKADAKTQQLQGKIVSDLEELIKQLRQQQQSQSSSSSSGQQKPQPTGKRDAIAQPQKQQQAAGGSKSATKPAGDSSQRVGKADVKKPDPGKIQDLIKDIWGELPARLRQQMLQSSVERFVPKYELQIEEYFKTLSEQKRGEQER